MAGLRGCGLANPKSKRRTEVLRCPECETELEVSQTHPVALNPISDELEEEDEEDLEEEEEDEEDFDEDGDLLDEDEEDEDDEDE